MRLQVLEAHEQPAHSTSSGLAVCSDQSPDSRGDAGIPGKRREPLRA